jgi:flagellar biosynthetic protein FliQ
VDSAATPDYFVGVAQQALWVLALTASPILIPALMAGLILGMIQAATSINEQTLSFVPKLIIIGLCLIIFGSAMLGLMADFMRDMFARIPDVVR